MKYFKIFLVCFVSVIFLNVLETKAQCAPGWSYASIQFGPEPYTGCYYDVEFCYLCHIVVGNPASTLKVLSIKPKHGYPYPDGCIAPDPSWLQNQIWQIIFQFCTVPPCSTGYLLTFIEYPVCFRWHTWGSLIGDQYSYYSWLEPCPGSGYCQVTRKVCLKNGVVVGHSSDPNPSYYPYNINCQSEKIPEPTEFDPDFEGEKVTSDCFEEYHCQ